MGWVEQRGGLYRLVFRIGGKKLSHALKVKSQKEADEALAIAERTWRLVGEQVVSVPDGVDLMSFLASGGRLQNRPAQVESVTVEEIFERYREAHREAQEENSLYTVRIHGNHLKKTLGPDFRARSLSLGDLQAHIDRRMKETRAGQRPSPATIRKEIASFSAVWAWGARLGLLPDTFPKGGLVYPKLKDKPPFQTRQEILARLARGKLGPKEVAGLWECLFLTLPEIRSFLGHVRAAATRPWVYPAVCIAAHTGARRSEILRSRLTDIDFASRTLIIHEKKRVRGRLTTRRVPMSDFLMGVLKDLAASHPGGDLTICEAPDTPIVPNESTRHFNNTLRGSEWEVVPGWHCLRHSFASNCAAKGIDQRLINAWIGHQTEEMARRYAHLVPSVSRDAMGAVFGPDLS